MSYRILADHTKIVEYTSKFLAARGWQIKTEYRLQMTEGGARLDLFAVNPKLNMALVVEAKKDSGKKAIAAGVGQLLFYRELLKAKTRYHDTLFALAVPGHKTAFKIDLSTKERIPYDKPRYSLAITPEAFDFAKTHNIGIFIVMDDETVRLSTKFPLGLWLIMKDEEVQE